MELGKMCDISEIQAMLIPSILRDKDPIYIRQFSALFHFVVNILEYKIITSRFIKFRKEKRKYNYLVHA